MFRKSIAYTVLGFSLLGITACSSAHSLSPLQSKTSALTQTQSLQSGEIPLEAIPSTSLKRISAQSLKGLQNAPLITETEQETLRDFLNSQGQFSQDFKVQSAEGGEDVDIELFLYNPKYGKRAKWWGIDNAREFLESGKSPSGRWWLKFKLAGMFAPRDFKYQILFWVEQADLLRVSGIDREQAWVLVSNGITSVPDLAQRTGSLEQKTLWTSVKLLAWTHGIDAPSLSEFKAWIEEAQSLDPLIY